MHRRDQASVWAAVISAHGCLVIGRILARLCKFFTISPAMKVLPISVPVPVRKIALLIFILHFLPVFRSHVTSHVSEHLAVTSDRRAGNGGQHVSGDGSGGSGLECSFSVVVEKGASGGETDVCLRVDIAEESDRTEDIRLRKFREMFQRRSRIGIRALIGMESMPSSARLIAISRRSSQVSPMPMMPPEQAHMPSALTF